MQAKLRDLQEELEEETRQRIFFEEASLDLEEDKAAVVGERDELAAAVYAAQQEVTVLKVAKGELAESLEATKQEVVHITAERDQLAVSLSATAKEVAEAKGDCDLLLSSTTALISERDSLSHELIITRAEADTSLQGLASANHELAASFMALKDGFDALEVEKDGLAVALALAEMDASVATSRFADLQVSFDALTVERDGLRATLISNQQATEATTRVLSTERDELTASLHIAEAKVIDVTAERDALRKALEHERGLHAATQAQHERVAGALAAERKKTRELQHAHVATRRQVAHLSERCSRLSSAIIALQRDKATLEGAVRAKDGKLALATALLRVAEDNTAGLRGRLEDAEAEVLVKVAVIEELEVRHALEVNTLNDAVRAAQAQADDERAARHTLEQQLAEARTQLDRERQRTADAHARVEAETACAATLQQRLHLAHDKLSDERRAARALEQDLHNAQLLATHYHMRGADDGPMSQEAKIARFKRAAAQVASLVAVRTEEERRARERAEAEGAVLKARLDEANARNGQLDDVVRRRDEKLASARAQLKVVLRDFDAYQRRFVDCFPGPASETQDEFIGLSKRRADGNSGYPFNTPTTMEESLKFSAKVRSNATRTTIFANNSPIIGRILPTQLTHPL